MKKPLVIALWSVGLLAAAVVAILLVEQAGTSLNLYADRAPTAVVNP